MPKHLADLTHLRTRMKELRSKGLTSKEIATRLGEGVTVGQVAHWANRKSQASDMYVRRKKSRTPVVSVVSEDDLPIETLGGIMHVLPLKPPRLSTAQARKGLRTCDVCKFEPMCRRWVERWEGDFIACERPLVSELINYEPSRSTEPYIVEITSPEETSGSPGPEPRGI